MFWDVLEHCGIIFFIVFFCKLLNHFLPLFPHTTHLQSCHVSSLTFSSSILPPPQRCFFLARSQERRYLLCPLCRSLAECQAEPMPIKAMSNGLKLRHSLCFPLFPIANKFEGGLNQREKLEHTAHVQQGVKHKYSYSLIRDKSWGGSHQYGFPCDPLCHLTGGAIIVWADEHAPAVCHETMTASGPLGRGRLNKVL